MPQEAMKGIAEATGETIQPNEGTGLLTDKIVSDQQPEQPNAPPVGEKAPTPEVKPEGDKTKEDVAEKVAESAGLNMDELSEAWYANGELPEDAYKSLEGLGFSKDVVDTLCTELTTGNELRAEKQVADFKADVANHLGGAETLDRLVEYMNTPTFDQKAKAELEAMIVLDNPASAKLAMEKVKSMYEKEYGSTGNPIAGSKSSGSAGDVYTSRSEQSKAIVEAHRSGDKSKLIAAQEKAGRTSAYNQKAGVNWN